MTSSRSNVPQDLPRKETDMEKAVREEIVRFVLESPENRHLEGEERYFDRPLVGFASVANPLFAEYRKIIGPFHRATASRRDAHYGPGGRNRIAPYQATACSPVLSVSVMFPSLDMRPRYYLRIEAIPVHRLDPLSDIPRSPKPCAGPICFRAGCGDCLDRGKMR